MKTRLTRFAALLAVTASTWSLAANAGTYSQLDTVSSSLSFGFSQMGVELNGRFPTFKGTLSYDPAHPADATTTIEVPLAPIDTGSAEGNDEVQGEDWFATDGHPSASFKSTSVKSTGTGALEVTGTLSIKGHARTVTIPVTVTESAGQASFDGAFKINRTDFGVGTGSWADPDVVAHEVTIAFHLVAAPKAQ